MAAFRIGKTRDYTVEYSGFRDTGVRGFGNRHSGSQETMIPGMETIHTMP